MSPPPPPDSGSESEPDANIPPELASQALLVAWVGAACMTCLVYDHALTFGQEVLRIWPARFTLARLLFFVNRYLVEAMLIFTCVASTLSNLSTDLYVHRSSSSLNVDLTSISCVFYLRWLDINLTIQTAIVQGILVLRVWALYRLNKRVLWAVYALYGAGSLVMLIITILDYIIEKVQVDRVVDLPGCYASSVPTIIVAYWIAPAVVESVLFFLVISRGFFWWKQGESIPLILRFMARDSTMYYAIIFALLIANLCMFYFAPPFLSSLLINPLSTASCILGSRLLLNLRAAVEPMTPSEWAVVASRGAEPVPLGGVGLGHGGDLDTDDDVW